MAQFISKMETSQTAVSWLIEEIHKNMGVWIPLHIQDQAKQMEKEQIMKAVDRGYDEGCKFPEDMTLRNSEQYYKETYGNTNSN